MKVAEAHYPHKSDVKQVGPAVLVLRRLRESSERWSLWPRVSKPSSVEDEAEFKLKRQAIEFVERLLAIRFRLANEGLLVCNGQELPFDEFPVSASFIRRWGETKSERISWACAYKIRKYALEYLAVSRTWQRTPPKTKLLLYRLKHNVTYITKAQAPLKDELLSTIDRCQVLMGEIFGTRTTPKSRWRPVEQG